MSKIEDKILLLKYLNYLISFSDQLLGKYDLTFSDLNQLVKENEVFHERVKASEYLSEKLKKNIFDIKISPVYDSSKNVFFKAIFRLRWFASTTRKAANYDVDEYREKIISYKKEITNFSMSLDQYTFYK